MVEPSPRDRTRDRIYADDYGRVGDFVFDAAVASVFEDMISRSVPGYGSILAMIDNLSRRYLQPNTAAYDLGCSTGSVSEILVRNLPSGSRLIAVDNSPAMLERCRQRLADALDVGLCEIIEGDLIELTLQPTSMAVLNFTLQFIAPEQRLPLLRRIHRSLLPGGALILSEKIRHPDEPANRLLIELHEQFKSANGYSQMEIARKRNALEKVLLPETIDTHLGRLEQAGFSSAVLWFQCFNFVSIVATA